jgi:hypothetical protein
MSAKPLASPGSGVRVPDNQWRAMLIAQIGLCFACWGATAVDASAAAIAGCQRQHSSNHHAQHHRSRHLATQPLDWNSFCKQAKDEPPARASGRGSAEACAPGRQLDIVLTLAAEDRSDVEQALRRILASLANLGVAAPCITIYAKSLMYSIPSQVLEAVPLAHRAVLTANVGREGASALLHAHDEYHDLARHTMFLQASAVDGSSSQA